MRVDKRLEELGVDGLGEVDEPAFPGLAAPRCSNPSSRQSSTTDSRPTCRPGRAAPAGGAPLRAVGTSVNRQPAVAFYFWQEREGAHLPLTIDVLRITGGVIAEVATFHADQFPRPGLPERLPADGTE